MSGADLQDSELIVLTGMSGAGRTTAARALEDVGWFVIDNIPPTLLLEALELASGSSDIKKVAVVVDTRSRSLFAQLRSVMADLARRVGSVTIVFLEATDESLVRRFESSRRPHPLQNDEGSLDHRIVDGLAREREILGEIRAVADLVIDTSSLNIHDLRRRIEAAFDSDGESDFHITVVSFGFKYGIPVDADMVADVRFLPNPYWDEDLRLLTGRDRAVSENVLQGSGAQVFLTHFQELLGTMREGYLREGKRLVTVAVGCTGGKHRSVAMTEELAAMLGENGHRATVFHRDLGRE
ncbi:MAG: RNase adapter RapZ [Candidatus Nanopelagicales bacterium]|nr:RNase adapter RapZ [Candidatus Nanopelagicales bacterium]